MSSRKFTSAGLRTPPRKNLDNENDWVRREIVAALSQWVLVVPVLVEARAMLGSADLPGDIRRLASLQVLTLKHGHKDRHGAELVDELFAAVSLLATAHADYLRRLVPRVGSSHVRADVVRD
ncbi:MAG: hypothetical protein ACRDTC_19825 [Pseudonocardiaceae bacterium]